jgi:hypothetical protein
MRHAKTRAARADVKLRVANATVKQTASMDFHNGNGNSWEVL